MELISYSFPDYKEVSQHYQYARYSQNDLLFVKSFELTTSTDCHNLTIVPIVYLINPAGEKQYFMGFESIPLANKTQYLSGIKNGPVKFDKDVITNGLPLKLTGDYSLTYNFQINGNERPTTGQEGISLSNAGSLLGEYPLTVVETSNLVKISTAVLAIPTLIVLIFAILLSILGKLLAKFRCQIQLISNFLKLLSAVLNYASLLLLILALTLAIVALCVGVFENTKKPEIEVEIFSIINLIAGLFVSLLAAFFGYQFINNNIITKQEAHLGNSHGNYFVNVSNIENFHAKTIQDNLDKNTVIYPSKPIPPISEINIPTLSNDSDQTNITSLAKKIHQSLEAKKELSTIAEMCLDLARQLKMKEDEDWLDKEVNGYFKNDTHAGLVYKDTSSSVFKPYRRINAKLYIKLSSQIIPETFNLKMFISQPLKEIETWANKDLKNSQAIIYTAPLQLMIEKLHVDKNASVPYVVQTNDIKNILSGFKTELSKFMERAESVLDKQRSSLKKETPKNCR